MHRRFLCFLVLVALAAYIVPAMTHGGATGVVKQRMDAMTEMKDAMQSLKGMLLEGQSYDADKVRADAGIIQHHAAQITALFPEGSLHEPSEALPEIWQSWDRFAALSRDLETYAGVLKAAADNERGSGDLRREQPADQRKQQQGSAFGGQQRAVSPMDDPEQLKHMPPLAAYKRITQVCRDCHGDYRKKDE